MNRNRLVSLLTLLAVFGWALFPVVAAQRPNIIVFLVDDQGFGDLGYHGNQRIRTPHMDAFARQALELTQFYAMPVCAPTRACLMTGRYHLRTGVTDVFGASANMKPEEITLAETMRDAGYATGIVGKWHLGDEAPRRPQDQGFQEALVLRGLGLRNYFNPELLHNGEKKQFKGYCMDIFTDHAIEFVRRHKDQPFLLYLAPNLIHTPLQVDDAFAEPFRKAGLDELTSKVYGMLKSVDDNFGRLLATLKEQGLEDNTLVWFTSDNGPCTGSTTPQRFMAGLRGLKGTVYENGIRVPSFIRWPREFQSGAKMDRIASVMDIMPTVLDACGALKPAGVKWDGMSLLPLLRKPQSNWPDRTIVFQWDGHPLPQRASSYAVRNQRYKLVQSVGIADRQAHIRNKYAELCAAQGRGPLTVEGEPRWELFDIASDPGETKDIAAQQPNLVRKMKAHYEAWFDDVWTRWQK